MPELDGYETLAAMKADERRAPSPSSSSPGLTSSTASCAASSSGVRLPAEADQRLDPGGAHQRVAGSEAPARRGAGVEPHHRAAKGGAQSLPLAAGGRPGLITRWRAAAGGTSPRDHVAFCDLRGFTAFAEQADPEQLMTLLSQYHRMMGEAITTHEGTLRALRRRRVMVFFNDPIRAGDHVDARPHGGRDARGFADLAAAWRELGYELGFGVGIAVGYATLGRIGFDGRHDYGAIGNVTILASRLSSQAQAGRSCSARGRSSPGGAGRVRADWRADAQGHDPPRLRQQRSGDPLARPPRKGTPLQKGLGSHPGPRGRGMPHTRQRSAARGWSQSWIFSLPSGP